MYISGRVHRPLQPQQSSQANLEQRRQHNKLRLKRRFESIFDKYEKDFTNIGDEIDLETGQLVVDNGHLDVMEHDRDVGLHHSQPIVPASDDELGSPSLMEDLGSQPEDQDRLTTPLAQTPQANSQYPPPPNLHSPQRNPYFSAFPQGDHKSTLIPPQTNMAAFNPAIIQQICQTVTASVMQAMTITPYQSTLPVDPAWHPPPLPEPHGNSHRETNVPRMEQHYKTRPANPHSARSSSHEISRRPRISRALPKKQSIWAITDNLSNGSDSRSTSPELHLDRRSNQHNVFAADLLTQDRVSNATISLEHRESSISSSEVHSDDDHSRYVARHSTQRQRAGADYSSNNDSSNGDDNVTYPRLGNDEEGISWAPTEGDTQIRPQIPSNTSRRMENNIPTLDEDSNPQAFTFGRWVDHWTDEDEALLMKLKDVDGFKWRAILKYFPTRTRDGLVSHWKAVRKRGPYHKRNYPYAYGRVSQTHQQQKGKRIEIPRHTSEHREHHRLSHRNSMLAGMTSTLNFQKSRSHRTYQLSNDPSSIAAQRHNPSRPTSGTSQETSSLDAQAKMTSDMAARLKTFKVVGSESYPDHQPRMMNPEFPPQPWSLKSEIMLFKLKEIDRQSWDTVMKYFPSRTRESVRSRWKKVIYKHPDRHAQLLERARELVQEEDQEEEGNQGNDEDPEAEKDGRTTRSSSPENHHPFDFKLIYGPLAIRPKSVQGAPYSAEDDELLVQLRRGHNVPWKECLPYFPPRTIDSIQTRWKCLVRWYRGGEPPQPYKTTLALTSPDEADFVGSCGFEEPKSHDLGISYNEEETNVRPESPSDSALEVNANIVAGTTNNTGTPEDLVDPLLRNADANTDVRSLPTDFSSISHAEIPTVLHASHGPQHTSPIEAGRHDEYVFECDQPVSSQREIDEEIRLPLVNGSVPSLRALQAGQVEDHTQSPNRSRFGERASMTTRRDISDGSLVVPDLDTEVNSTRSEPKAMDSADKISCAKKRKFPGNAMTPSKRAVSSKISENLCNFSQDIPAHYRTLPSRSNSRPTSASMSGTRSLGSISSAVLATKEPVYTDAMAQKDLAAPFAEKDFRPPRHSFPGIHITKSFAAERNTKNRLSVGVDVQFTEDIDELA